MSAAVEKTIRQRGRMVTAVAMAVSLAATALSARLCSQSVADQVSWKYFSLSMKNLRDAVAADAQRRGRR